MANRTRDLTPDKSVRHLLGAELRRHRQEAGMTLEALASTLHTSKSSLDRYETATTMVPPDIPPALDACFGTDGAFSRLYRLARHEVHPDQFERRMRLERQATLYAEYSGQLIPGLIQTETYARGLIAAWNRRHPEKVEGLVAARMARQDLLDRLQLSIVLDEAAVRRMFGPPEAAREQLQRLVDLTDTPRSTVQVLPYSTGGHALMGGTLTLMQLDNGERVAYEESITRGTLLEDSESVTERQVAYDQLRAHALTPEASARLFRQVMKEF